MLGVMYLDLDGFKLVNDTQGHHMGDRLLQVIAQRINALTRAGDTAVRVGSDEFVVITPDAVHPSFITEWQKNYCVASTKILSWTTLWCRCPAVALCGRCLQL